MKKILIFLLLGASAAWGAFRTDQLTVTGLSPNECVQTDSNSKLTTTGSACGSGGASVFTATLSDGQSATILMGAAGVWKAAGALSFTASYSNGTAIGSTITFSGWGSSLPMASPFAGPTASAENVSYPSVGGSIVFTLSASAASSSDSDTLTHNFYNYRFWGVSTIASGFTEANVEAFSNSELSNSKAKSSFSVTAGSGEYLVWASPTRLGTVTFTVGGFEGGFNGPETVSITNSSGFAENYYVYASVNSNLGTVNIVTQ